MYVGLEAALTKSVEETGSASLPSTEVDEFVHVIDGPLRDLTEHNNSNTTQRPHLIKVRGSSDPINEFEANDLLLYKAFADYFTLGRGLLQTGSVPKKAVRHMMFQFTGRFSSCSRLVFCLFNQLQRHAVSRSVAARVKSNPDSFDEFANWVSDPLFISQLHSAQKNPTTKDAKELLAKIRRHIVLHEPKIPYSIGQRASTMSHLFAMRYHFGLPSGFFTFSADDIHGVLNLRLSLPQKDNFNFPADGRCFRDALKSSADHHWDVPISPSALRKLLSSGPVAAAEVFNLMVNALFTILLGLPPDEFKRKSKPLCSRQAGIMGTPVAACGCTECQQRGSLHMHLVFWGGLPPFLLQSAGGLPFLEPVISAVLERIVRTHLDPNTHLRQLLTEIKGSFIPSPCLYKAHDPHRCPMQFEEDVQRAIVRTNIHRHCPTCYKNNCPICRMARPQSLIPCTRCVQITTSSDTEKYRVLDEIQSPSFDSHDKRNINRLPMPIRDDRILFWEMYRPRISYLLDGVFSVENEKTGEFSATDEDLQDQFNALEPELQDQIVRCMLGRNGMVVETSDVAAVLLGCNTNLSILGSDSQSKASMCYLLKYITKPPAEIFQSLSLLYHARMKIQKYPSKAEDTGSDRRTAMHYVSCIMNQTNGLNEVSSQMAGAAIIGMPAETMSHKFTLVFPTATLEHIDSFWKNNKNPDDIYLMEDDEFGDVFEPLSTSDAAQNDDKNELQDTSNNDEDRDPLDFILENGYIYDECEPPQLFGQKDDQAPRSSNGEAVDILNSATGKAVVPSHTNYIFRGNHLLHLSYYEYAALISIVPISKKSVHNQCAEDLGGRPVNNTFSFSSGHPLVETHTQRIRSKSLVPVLVLPPPKPPSVKPKLLTDDWKNQARKFARYILVLYQPWGDGNGIFPSNFIWKSYVQFMNELTYGPNRSGQTHLGRIRLEWVKNAAHGMRITNQERVAARSYRSRAATVFGRPDGSSALPRSKEFDLDDMPVDQFEDSSAVEARELIDQLRNENAMDDLLIRRNHKELEYHQSTLAVLDSIMNLQAVDVQSRRPLSLPVADKMLHSNNQPNAITPKQVLATLKNPPEEIDAIEPFLIPTPAGGFEAGIVNSPLFELVAGLNDGQQLVYNACLEFFLRSSAFHQNIGPRPIPFRYLVLGGPGNSMNIFPTIYRFK